MNGIFLIILAAIFMVIIGFVNGYIRGVQKGIDIHNEVECQSKYDLKPLEKVEAKCLKYYKK